VLQNCGGGIVDRNNKDLGFKITHTFKKTIQHIEWNKAKSIWLQEFIYCSELDYGCKCSEYKLSLKIDKTVDKIGSEHFLHPIIYSKKYYLFSCC
jgi:hypothetical protein